VKTSIALGLVNLAGYCIAAGDWTTAHGHAREAVNIMKETQHHLFFLVAMQHAAALGALAPSGTEESAQTAQAARLLGYTDACFLKLGFLREPNEQREYDRVIAKLRQTYTEDELMALLASGAEMTPDRAVNLALSM
jgi:hypothetical protein